jgi:hypothetical protein
MNIVKVTTVITSAVLLSACISTETVRTEPSAYSVVHAPGSVCSFPSAEALSNVYRVRDSKLGRAGTAVYTRKSGWLTAAHVVSSASDSTYVAAEDGKQLAKYNKVSGVHTYSDTDGARFDSSFNTRPGAPLVGIRL